MGDRLALSHTHTPSSWPCCSRPSLARPHMVPQRPSLRFGTKVNQQALEADFDHITGPEAEEQSFKAQSVLPHGETYLSGPFGTPENPVIVRSVFAERVIGCMGGEGDHAHDLLWHVVRVGRPTLCLECGQAFK